eukprot:10795044-Alexandrium_andersonii.AAC.1
MQHTCSEKPRRRLQAFLLETPGSSGSTMQFAWDRPPSQGAASSAAAAEPPPPPPAPYEPVLRFASAPADPEDFDDE